MPLLWGILANLLAFVLHKQGLKSNIMRIFEEHFNKKSLLGTPHKWFFAFLSSPIHAAEVHYKKRYHLKFRHARKLFIFDMLLMAFIVLLIGATIFWKLYDPTVTDLVYVHIEQSEGRISSGQEINYTVEYKNGSDVALEDIKLSIPLPVGFDSLDISPNDKYDAGSQTFLLGSLAPAASGKVHIEGRLFQVPGKPLDIVATLSYKQEGQRFQEVVARRSITTLQGSLLEASITASEKVLDTGTSVADLIVVNNSKVNIEGIVVPLVSEERGVSFALISSSLGYADGDNLIVERLAPGQRFVASVQVKTNIPNNIDSIKISLVPEITIEGQRIAQHPASKVSEVLHPNISAQTVWIESPELLLPGESAGTLRLVMTNDGNSALKNLSVSIPYNSAILDGNRTVNNFASNISGGAINFSYLHQEQLRLVEPGREIVVDVPLYVSSFPTGDSPLRVSLLPSLRAEIDGIEGLQYERSFPRSQEKFVRGNMYMTGEARYFTAEGDQLGRGPIPPRVGEETKYWIIYTVQNGPDEITDAYFETNLAPGVSATGRSSVSAGRDVQISGNKLTWSLGTIRPNQTIGIRAEVSVTPGESLRGQVVPLTTSAFISAKEERSQTTLRSNVGALSSSLPNDAIGRGRGTVVQ